MLIDRERLFLVVIFFKITTKPVRKTLVDRSHRFSKAATAEGRSTAPGIVRDHHCKSRILRAGPEGGFSQSRVPQYDNTRCVDLFLCFKIIHRPTQSPTPSPDRLPLVRFWLGLSGTKKEWLDTIGKTIVEVRVQISAMGSGHSVSAG